MQAPPRQGLDRPRIARELGKSEGYVNNLILLRWKAEQGGSVPSVWLVQICVLPHAEQDAELAHRIAATRPR